MVSEKSLHPNTRSSVYDLALKNRQQSKHSTAKSTLTEEIDFSQRSGFRVGSGLRILKGHHPDPALDHLLLVAVRRIRANDLSVVFITGAETNRSVDLLRMMMMTGFRLNVTGGYLMVLCGWGRGRSRRWRRGCFLEVEAVQVLLHRNGGCDWLKALRSRPCANAESSRRVLRVILPPRRRRFVTVVCCFAAVRTVVPFGSAVMLSWFVLVTAAVRRNGPSWSDEGSPREALTVMTVPRRIRWRLFAGRETKTRLVLVPKCR